MYVLSFALYSGVRLVDPLKSKINIFHMRPSAWGRPNLLHEYKNIQNMNSYRQNHENAWSQYLLEM